MSKTRSVAVRYVVVVPAERRCVAEAGDGVQQRIGCTTAGDADDIAGATTRRALDKIGYDADVGAQLVAVVAAAAAAARAGAVEAARDEIHGRINHVPTMIWNGRKTQTDGDGELDRGQ